MENTKKKKKQKNKCIINIEGLNGVPFSIEQ